MTTKNPVPEAALKKHIAILGMNGSGKTSVAKAVIIEPALFLGERVCNIDPTGVGWGLRLKADGKSKGYAIYIVGGEHADFPLHMRDGAAWAEIVGTTSDSFVFDTSQMTVADRSRWFTAFAETLLRKNKGPLKLVIDEAHLFAPQGGAKAGGSTPDMLHATNNLLALGRSRGLRVTMISQRPAKLHKDSLTQAHTLIAMSLMAPHDRNAVSEWIADQADQTVGKQIIASLPTLEPGEGWIWAPKENVLDRVAFPRPKTFDSSSAPDDADGEGPKLFPVDPDAIKAKLETVAKETSANDPAKLRGEIARLKAELAKKPVDVKVNDPAGLKSEYERGYGDGFGQGMALAVQRDQQFRGALQKTLADLPEFDAKKFQRVDIPHTAAPTRPTAAMPQTETRRPASPPRRSTNGSGDSLPKGEKACLICIAQHGDGVTKEQLTVVTGYKRSSRDTYLQRLRERGHIEQRGNTILATETGVEALGSDYEPLPTGEALRDFHLQRLPEGERRVLEVLIEAYPEGVPRETIDEKTEYKRSSRDTYLQRLSARQLVTSLGRGEVRASDQLFA